MAIDGFVVNGTALVYVGTGTAGAFELLGYTDGGVRMRIIQNFSPIMSDVIGPMTPHDFQNMGMIANVMCPLIAIDRTVAAKIQGRGDRTSVGQISTPGLVMGVGGHAFKVGIASASVGQGAADSPWTFNNCIVQPGFDTQLATKAFPMNFEFYAWPWTTYTTTAAKDTVLWARTAVPS